MASYEYFELDQSGGFTNEKLAQNIRAFTAGNRVKGVFYYTGTIDVAGLDEAGGATSSITITGVALGDMVVGISAGVDLQDLNVTGYVQSANTVELKFSNVTVNSVDLASTTFEVIVWDLT